jgi:hypothetical protein
MEKGRMNPLKPVLFVRLEVSAKNEFFLPLYGRKCPVFQGTIPWI